MRWPWTWHHIGQVVQNNECLFTVLQTIDAFIPAMILNGPVENFKTGALMRRGSIAPDHSGEERTRGKQLRQQRKTPLLELKAFTSQSKYIFVKINTIKTVVTVDQRKTLKETCLFMKSPSEISDDCGKT